MAIDLGYRVLHRPLCPFCRRLRAYLAIKGLDVDLVRYDPDTDRDELCAANPKGQVPTCALPSGLVLYESSIIMQYLEEAYPEPRLMPESPEARARMRLLFDLADARLASQLHGFVRAPLDSPDRETFAQGFVRVASEAERRCGPGPFCEGAQITLGDLSVPPLVLRAIEAGLDPERIPPRLRAWCENVVAQPAVRELFPKGLGA